jgi:hypothetical protein
MGKYDNQKVFHNRYLMYDDEGRSKAWRLDISNYDGVSILRVNGKRVTASEKLEERLLKADVEMMRAFGALMIAANKQEEPNAPHPAQEK